MALRSKTILRFLSAILLIAQCSVHILAAAEEDSHRKIAKKADEIAERAGTVSADGVVRVSGSAFNTPAQHIIRGFAVDVLSRLRAVTGLEFPPSEYRIWIIGKRGDSLSATRYRITLVPGALKMPAMATIRINVENPNGIDARKLADSITEGLFLFRIHRLAGAKTRESGENNKTEYGRLPAWFTTGIARNIDSGSRQAYAEECLELWQEGRLPPVCELASENSVYASVYGGAAAQLVSFWLDFPERDKRLETLCRRLAQGQKWSPELFAETSAGAMSAADLDQKFDEWMCGRRFAVLTAGVTYPDFILRTLRRLYVTPGINGVPVPAGQRRYMPLSVEDLTVYSGDPWIKEIAKDKARFLGLVSAGRGDKFRESSLLFSEFFRKLAAGEKPKKLRSLWRKAENAMFESRELVPSPEQETAGKKKNKAD